MSPTIDPKNIQEISQTIADSFQKIEELVNRSTAEQFHLRKDGKWSIGENLDHLVLSSMGIASVLARSKDIFSSFGSLDRPAYSYAKLNELYESRETRVAPGNVVPDEAAPKTKEELLQSWQLIAGKYQQRLSEHWTEEELDQHCLPHPAISKLSMREHLFMIAIHNYHHLKTMQGLLDK